MYGLALFLKTTKMTGGDIWGNWWSINHSAIITVFSQSKACGWEQEFPEHKGKVKSGSLLCNFHCQSNPQKWVEPGGPLTKITAGWYLLFSFHTQVKDNKKAVNIKLSWHNTISIKILHRQSNTNFNYYSFCRYIHRYIRARGHNCISKNIFSYR